MFDNTDTVKREGPMLVLEAVDGVVVSLATEVPGWTVRALRGTGYEITAKLRRRLN